MKDQSDMAAGGSVALMCNSLIKSTKISHGQTFLRSTKINCNLEKSIVKYSKIFYFKFRCAIFTVYLVNGTWRLFEDF